MMNLVEAVVELGCVLTDAWEAADLAVRLREWWWVVRHPGLLDGPPPSPSSSPSPQDGFAPVLTERQRQILALAYAWSGVTNGDVRKVCFWHTETIRRDMVHLVQLGLLERRGEKKGTYYVPVFSVGD